MDQKFFLLFNRVVDHGTKCYVPPYLERAVSADTDAKPYTLAQADK